ncbi:MAG: SGNH/GDSL hydrolase family protein [Ruminococcaceae bacterium]|nr:SGNH/GDSL hydrolase family protein [Oscillospiraceae bacterium]
MKKRIKITALLLAVSLVLSGCADNAVTSSATDSSTETSATQSEVESKDEASSSKSEVESKDESSATESETQKPEETPAPETTTTQTTTNAPETESKDETSMNETQTQKPEEKPDADPVYSAMVDRSLMELGNLQRMKKFFEKLEKGEEVTVAFIGGSITEGMTAGAELCWAKLTYEALCEQYPNAKINYVNAGMSGTPSILGNIRAGRDVLCHNPDLTFVEFAVNDGGEQDYKDSYEALVRTLLEQEDSPAVALYFTVIKSGHTCEKHMSEIGRAYGLPMVSLNNVLSVEFESGRMKWEDYSDDESHPNVWGHEMTKDLIMNMMNKAKAKIDEGGIGEVEAIPEKWVNNDRYYGMKYFDDANPLDGFTMIDTGSFSGEGDTIQQFPNGWAAKIVPTDAKPMKFTFTGKTLMMVYKCVKSQRGGSLKVTVDGKVTGTYSTQANDGWNNPVAVQVFTGAEGVHEVTIELVDKDGKLIVADILGFGVC